MIDAGGLLSKIFFRGTRVRDGSVGRINLVVVYFVTLGFFPLISLLSLNSNISEAHASFLMSYCWQGHIWGDPAAEIVGSFFGRVEFSVAGFGEINKKTVEGVWLDAGPQPSLRALAARLCLASRPRQASLCPSSPCT